MSEYGDIYREIAESESSARKHNKWFKKRVATDRQGLSEEVFEVLKNMGFTLEASDSRFHFVSENLAMCITIKWDTWQSNYLHIGIGLRQSSRQMYPLTFLTFREEDCTTFAEGVADLSQKLTKAQLLFQAIPNTFLADPKFHMQM